MAESIACRGHGEREARKNKIIKLLGSTMENPDENLMVLIKNKKSRNQERADRWKKVSNLSLSAPASPDENLRMLIKRGPVSVETSLKELEENYASKPGWKVIGEGGVLSIPVGEFRMIDPPNFGQNKRKKGTKIENYTVGQTIDDLNDLVLTKFNEEKENAKAAGKSEAECEQLAAAAANKLPQFSALRAWQGKEAEIKLKKAVTDMMTDLKIPTLIIRSVSLKAISALKDLGLKLSGDAEIDLVMAYVSGNFLHVVICEVKTSIIFPWKTQGAPPNKQAAEKAELQLTKDVDILMAILAGIPPNQIIFHTLACFPDASFSELQTIFCADCLESGVICQEDLTDLSLLQKKTRVPDKPDPVTTSGRKKLLILTTRCLSDQSLLHIGNREIEDKEKLDTERHRYNIESVDGKMKQNEFVVASPQQQQVIASFTASSTKRHLVLEGPAGTGKTLVALQVAKSLHKSTTDTFDTRLVVTTHRRQRGGPIQEYLVASSGEIANKRYKGWWDIMKTFGVQRRSPKGDMDLIQLTEALAKRWERVHQIVILIDEICYKDILNKREDQSFPESVRMILVLNPTASLNDKTPLTLPPSFLHVTLTTPYRSTIAITRLARFISKCRGLVVPEGDFGSDVEGTKPIFFDVGRDKRKMEEALEHCRKHLGDNATILYSHNLSASVKKMVKKQGKNAGGPWDCSDAADFAGWEAERVVAVTSGYFIIELITRAKTRLSVIIADGPQYPDSMKYFQQAAELGLVEEVQLSEEAETEDETDGGALNDETEHEAKLIQ